MVAKNNDPNEPAGTHNSMAPAAGHTEPYEYNLGSPPTAGTTPSRALQLGVNYVLLVCYLPLEKWTSSLQGRTGNRVTSWVNFVRNRVAEPSAKGKRTSARLAVRVLSPAPTSLLSAES